MSSGDDIYYVNNSDDVITEEPNGGRDRVYARANFILPPNVEDLIFLGRENRIGTGNDLDNLIVGNSGNDILSGLGGNDHLYGGDGNDTLYGGSGTNLMVGGKGDDIYYVDSTTDILVERANEGYDRVFSSVTHALQNNFEDLTLTGMGNSKGVGNAFANHIIGNGGDNALYGGGGDDILEGGGGTNLLVGGTGNDTYYVTSATDTLVEYANEGYDHVFSSVTHALQNNFEELTLTGTGDIKGVGNAQANVITGNIGNNALYGGGGNDVLNGGLGNDLMVGGTGDDTYYVDNKSDVVVELRGEGIDTIHTLSSYTLPGNVEILIGDMQVPNGGPMPSNVLIGNDLDNIIHPGYGVNRIDGGFGADTLYGGAFDSDDTFVIDNPGDVIIPTSGNISRVESSISFTLPFAFYSLTLTGAGDINGTGNSLENEIHGNAGKNTLNGGDGNDYVYGHGGADIIYGGDGDDFLYGGGQPGTDTQAADDMLFGGAGRDNLSNADGGIDYMTGGEGVDVFRFDATLGEQNQMIITDFEHGKDYIFLPSNQFPGMTMFQPDPSEFFVGTAAQTAQQHLIYNNATGDIFYDADGSGSADAVRFAHVTPGTTLTASDFLTYFYDPYTVGM